MARRVAQQLELEVVPIETPQRPRRNGSSPCGETRPTPRAQPDETAALLGVSRDYLDEHVIAELRIVRRGRRILIALAELQRWLDRSATPAPSLGASDSPRYR